MRIAHPDIDSHCPYSCSCTNVDDPLWILQGGKEELVIKRKEKKVMTALIGG